MTHPRILLLTAGSAGDMHPFLGLAAALQRRGQRVTLIGPAVHAAMAAQAQVPFHGLGEEADYQAALKDPALWDPRKGFEIVWRHMMRAQQQLHELFASLPADEPLLAVAHPLALVGADLLRQLRPGTRIAAAYLAPANLRSCHGPVQIGPLRTPAWMPPSWRHWIWRRIDARFIDPVALPGLNAARAAQGQPPVAHFIDHLLAVADLSITLFPDWFAPTPPDWPQPMLRGAFPLYEPDEAAELAPSLSAFLAAGEPPIAFTRGTAHRHTRAFFEQALQATQRLGRRALLLNADRAQLPAELPSHAHWQPYAPFHRLLPRVAALVHHGGIGTTAQALRAGVPQLITPLAHDQFDNAARVQALGVGRVLGADLTSSRPLARALQALLSDRCLPARQAAAQRLAGSPDLAPVCEALERLLPAPIPAPGLEALAGIAKGADRWGYRDREDRF